MLFRLITIREHKNIVFCDSFNEKYEKIQVAIPTAIFNKYNLKIGSVIFANYNITKNKYDNDLYMVENIQEVFIHEKNITYKSINNNSMSMNQSSFVTALNGGINLKYWEMKQRLLEEIRKFLINKSLF